MKSVQNRRTIWRSYMKCAASIAAIFLLAAPCKAQSTPARQQSELPWTKDLNRYPGLLDELGRLYAKLQQDVQFPAPRAESHLLPLLPASTMSYAAFPNYGDVLQQTLATFRQELQESTVLRDWWAHGELAAGGPKFEESLEKLSQFDQFLGEEIVVSGAMDGHEPKFLVVAGVKKPGLKQFLQQWISQLSIDRPAGDSQPEIRVLDVQELATAKDTGKSNKLLVLVRSDFVVAASDLATLRGFNARLDSANREFSSSVFGKRVAQEYQSGVTVLAAADLQKILNQAPPSVKQNVSLQQSGFADMKYLVWDHKIVGGESFSQSELSFNAPRHGTASWLAKPAPLSNLDFVSPKAILASTVVLTSPAQIFEDVKAMSTATNPNSFATIAAFEKMLNLSLKDDLLRYLTGELTVELDNLAPPNSTWTVILGVNDADHLQKTLSTLLTVANFQAQPMEDGGITYYKVRIPSGKTVLEIGYTFADGHLIVGSSQEVVSDAVHLHQSGESLGKAPKLLAALPPGRTLEASAMLYEDPTAMAALGMRQIAPGIAQTLAQFSRDTKPTVVCLYGEDSAIREASKSASFDAGTALIVAAVAIPNLLRSRMAANEASAVGSLRSVNTAQVTYAGTYPQRGYASDLAKLGLDPGNPKSATADHAGFLDKSLANESCAAGGWCTKSGYRFAVKSVCRLQECSEYVAVATPVDFNTGTRSFCSISDTVIRYRPGSPLTAPLSVAECKAWPPLK
ncbi:MAG: hypothetical protein WBE13_06480 [Candidatus Acidiferrum sp.]